MDNKIIIFGDIENIDKNIINNRKFVKKDDIMILSVKNNETTEILENINLLKNITAITANQFYKKPVKKNFEKFDKINFDYSWQEDENIIIQFADNFEILKVDKKLVTSKFSIPGIPKYQISNCGNIFAFMKGNKAILYANESLDRYFETEMDSEILNAKFSLNDKFLVLETKNISFVYNLEIGKLIYQFKTQNYQISLNKIKLEKLIFNLDLLEEEFFEGIEIWNKNDKAILKKDKLSKIIYEHFDGKNIVKSSKTHAYLIDCKFYFFNKKLFAILKKSINNLEHFSIESYFGKEITTTPVDSNVLEISASKKLLVIFTENKNLMFYEKGKYSFNLIKSIKKEGNVILSTKGFVTVVYDSMSSNLEIYDKGILRAVFGHNSCTQIKWSNSGLYFVAFSESSSTGGMVQIFTCNGKLIYKKVYVRIKSLEWRPFNKIPESEKVKILEENEILMDEVDSEDYEDDPSSLLSAWKGYLMSKMQDMASSK